MTELKLDANNKLFTELEKNPPTWWSNLKKDKELSIDIRKGNYINVYYNGGSILKLEWVKNEFRASIHYKYIPIKNNGDPYIKLETNNNLEINKADFDKLEFDEINNFEHLETIKNQVKKYYSSNSEKGFQGKFATGDFQFIDSEFQMESGRFDLIWVDINTQKFFCIELKLPSNKELFEEKGIEAQLKKYRSYVSKNKAELEEFYKKIFLIKKNLNILPEKLKNIDNINDYSFEEKPILAIIDCSQKWIDDNREEINATIENTAFGCFYLGKPSFVINNKTNGNKFIFKKQ